MSYIVSFTAIFPSIGYVQSAAKNALLSTKSTMGVFIIMILFMYMHASTIMLIKWINLIPKGDKHVL
jgi:hypothetical protein